MKFRDDNYPKRDYDKELRLMVQDKLDSIIKFATKKCPLCGKELKFDHVDMYDHDGGWFVIPEIPKQWISTYCHNCNYDVSLSKLGVAR